jgi:murein tripeptide amidase MpaA
MKMKAIGKSGQGNDMHAIVITSSPSPQSRFYFQCQIHAREWISGMTCAYVINYLLENNQKDDAVTRILAESELHIIPFVNPDGFKYTWSNDRLWRKNRSPNTGTSCIGTDLNRNYNDHWNGGGSSTNPCSETYMGKAAGSEIEVQVTTNYFQAIPPVVGAIDWHSYSQLVLRPYGWTTGDSPDEARLKQIGDSISATVLGVHGMRYTSQKSIQLYVTTGTASDWFYGKEATEGNQGYRAAGYTIELRDTGNYGFQLPANQIIPQGEEIVPAVKYFMLTLIDEPIQA